MGSDQLLAVLDAAAAEGFVVDALRRSVRSQQLAADALVELAALPAAVRSNLEAAATGPLRGQAASYAARINEAVSDDDIAAMAFDEVPAEEVPLTDDVVAAVLGAGLLARYLAAFPQDRSTLRALLALGFVDAIPKLSPGDVEADGDAEGIDISRSAAASAMADLCIEIAEQLEPHVGGDATVSVAALNDALDIHFVEVIRLYPDVVGDFDARIRSLPKA